MGENIRGHIRSNVVGYVALFIALSGTAYATHPGGANTISSGDIINGQVASPDISNTNGVRSVDVRDDTLTGGGLGSVDIAPDSLTGADIANTDSLGSPEIGGLGGGDIFDGSITGDDLATDAVGQDEIAPLAVDTGALADGSVEEAKLADGAVRAPKLGIFSVTTSKIFSNAVTGSKIADGAVSNATIADNAVTGAKITDGTVDQNDIGSSGVDASELGAITERTVDFAVPENEVATATVSCASGEQVISGGYDFTFPRKIVVSEFRRSGNGWRLSAFNLGGAGDLGGTSVYAYCLNPGS